VKSGGDETGRMGDISKEIRPNFVRDLAKTLEVDEAAIGAGAGNDPTRPDLFRFCQRL
jgi:hypothetical protein